MHLVAGVQATPELSNDRAAVAAAAAAAAIIGGQTCGERKTTTAD